MTGVANPGPVISSFWLDDGLHSVLKLDGIVCVVDGLHIEQYLQSEDISYDVTRQICYADRILINKCDLIQPEQDMAINVIVRSLNGLAEIRHTSLSSKVSLDFVLDINGYATNIENILSRGVFDDLASPAKDSMCHPCKPVTSHTALTLSTQSISFTGVLSLRELEIYLNTILYECSNNDVPKTHSPAINKDSDDMKIFRMKGVVHIDGDQHLHILQGVHDTYEIKPSRIVAGSPEDTSRNNNLITIIGKRIDAEALRQGFIRCKETGWSLVDRQTLHR